MDEQVLAELRRLGWELLPAREKRNLGMLVTGVTDENRHEEVDTGPPIGRKMD